MQLSDNEKRDILKFIENGKPLPEKYRFLLFDDKREVELVWNGKTNEVTNVVLPFQVIEQVDTPRGENKIGLQQSLYDDTGRQIMGWTNKLIWGDNKLILSSFKNGPMRKEIEAQGGLKLIYIDPPFDVGADFSMDIEIGEETFTKKPSVIEEIAYRDTWGKGADSFIAMIYERLSLMHDLLAEDGSIYVHCDYRVSAYIKLVLDQLFSNYIAEIAWQKLRSVKSQSNHFSNIKDSIFVYSKSKTCIFNPQFVAKDEKLLETHYRHLEKETGRRYNLADFTQVGNGSPRTFGDKVMAPPSGKHWIWSQEKIDEGMKNGMIIFSGTGTPYVKRYFDTGEGTRVGDIWNDIFPVNQVAQERTDYPTQKPESLLERIIKASSNEGDLVADFFCGSGTTLAVAEKLNRKWIGSDLGRFGIHTSRKRMIGVQRAMKAEGKDFRPFEILNIGRYERDNYLVVNDDLRAEEKAKIQEAKEQEFLTLILSAYKAEPVGSFTNIVGKKRDRLIAVGPISLPVSSQLIQDIVKECAEKGITKVDVLGFDYEMGLDLSVYKSQGIDIVFRIIPREVFDKQAVEKGQVKFYDVAFIEAKPIIAGTKNSKTVAIELTDFSVFYNQDDSGEIQESLRPGGTKIIVENGQVYKVSKDKDTQLIDKDRLTTKWSDWVDYWAVDYNYTSRKEMIRIPKTHGDNLFEKGKVLDLFDYDEVWTGDFIFDNEWQSFRTKKNRVLDLTSVARELPHGTHKIAIKVVDIFGNDTTKVIEVKI